MQDFEESKKRREKFKKRINYAIASIFFIVVLGNGIFVWFVTDEVNTNDGIKYGKEIKDINKIISEE